MRNSLAEDALPDNGSLSDLQSNDINFNNLNSDCINLDSGMTNSKLAKEFIKMQ